MSIAPALQRYALPFVVDERIEAQPEVYMEAGDHETLLHMASTIRLFGYR